MSGPGVWLGSAAAPLALVTAILTALLPSTAASAAAPAPDVVPPRIGVSDSVVTYGGVVSVTAAATAGRTVHLWAAAAPAPSFHVIRTAEVPRDGTVDWVLSPRGTTRLYVQEAAGERSAVSTVQVRRTVTLGVRRAADVHTFSGVVERREAGLPVTIATVLDDGRPAGIASTRTRTDGSYAVGTRLPPGTRLHDALTAATADLLPGRSRSYGLSVGARRPAAVTVTLGARALGGGAYRLAGVVHPARGGLPVTLAGVQRGRLVGLAGTRTDSRGGYAFLQRLAPGSTTAFQVLTSAGAGVQAGRSPVYGIAAPPRAPVGCRFVAPHGQTLAGLVVTPRLPARAPVPSGSPASLLRRALLSVNRYALTTLYRGRALDPADRRPPPDGPRSSGAEALALASTLATGAYDAGLVGSSSQRVRAVAVWLVGAQACGHAAVTPGGWGAAGGGAPVPTDLHAWMSPLAAAQVGQAGWLLWPVLPDTDRRNVTAMVAAEADLLLRVSPGYLGRPDGHVLSPGDTKAEEDAWMTNVLGLASAMMPGHPHAPAWRRQEAAFQVAAFSTAADAISPRLVNGRPLHDWLDGWNVAADGTVVNHGIDPHPDYMATASLNLFAAAVDALADRPTLRTAVRGASLVYSSLLHRSFAAPPYAAPGGTIYRRGSGQLYSPVTSDWGTSLRAHFVGFDAAAAALGVSGEAPAFLRLHAQALLDMQARSQDGRTYQSWDEYRYTGREQWVAEQLARAWLVLWAADGGRRRLPITDAPIE